MKVLIVGGGQVGIYLASLLLERGHDIRVIEQRDSRIPVLKRELPEKCIIHANGADPKILVEAGVQAADVVAAVTGADETNLVVGTLAKLEYGVHRVIGRVNNPKNAWLFTPTMGIDATINQADLMAKLVAEEMTMGDMMTLLKLHGGQYSLVERVVDPTSPVADKTVREISLPEECIFVAVLRDSQLLLPRGSTRLMANDAVVMITHTSQLEKLASLLGPQN